MALKLLAGEERVTGVLAGGGRCLVAFLVSITKLCSLKNIPLLVYYVLANPLALQTLAESNNASD